MFFIPRLEILELPLHGDRGDSINKQKKETHWEIMKGIKVSD